MDIIRNFQLQNGLLADGILGKKSLLKLKELLNIPTNEELANFVGQVIHETGNFKTDTESLNYSSKGLLATFPKYFNKDTAIQYERKPERIANYVYSNRMGNGDEKSGDGWKYKGRGALMLTGRENYTKFSKYVDDDEIILYPELINVKYFFESAKYFFDKNNIWKYAKKVNKESITKISKIINGGEHGLKDRIEQVSKNYQLLQ